MLSGSSAPAAAGDGDPLVQSSESSRPEGAARQPRDGVIIRGLELYRGDVVEGAVELPLTADRGGASQGMAPKAINRDEPRAINRPLNEKPGILRQPVRRKYVIHVHRSDAPAPSGHQRDNLPPGWNLIELSLHQNQGVSG